MSRAARQLRLGQQADGGGGPLGLGQLPELEAQVGVPRDGGGFVKMAAVGEVVEGHRVHVSVERDGLVVNWREGEEVSWSSREDQSIKVRFVYERFKENQKNILEY